MVISPKLSESEMGYRGSKSEIIYKYPQSQINHFSVKEQRVDGSYFIYQDRAFLSGHLPDIKVPYKFMKLRCTLMGGESHYQFRIPTKQFNIKCPILFGAQMSTLVLKSQLKP